MAQEFVDLENKFSKLDRTDRSDADSASLQKIQNWEERSSKLTDDQKSSCWRI
ncbi:hypothetical protein [Mycoplasma sp. SK341A]|uniref:hypothetical protein n=1 Tax=Mycoplasma sp. SK341A TaxID=3401679 RepID=UPI003AAD172C